MSDNLPRRIRNRRLKLLRIMPRGVLEDMASHHRPWTLTRTELEKMSIVNFDEDVVREELESILRATKEPQP